MGAHAVSLARLARPAARYGAVASLLLLAAAVRLTFLLQWPRRLNIDESTAGLIGLHVLRGEFPVFMYSVAYEGTADAYLAAIIYALFGPSPLAAKVVPFLFSCALVAVALLIGTRMAGWPGGLGAALLTALPPPFLAVYGNFPMLGYVEVLVIGSLVLLLALELAADETCGAVRFQNDHEPLLGGYPTSRWKGGERVRERYEVQLPADLPPDDYEILIGLWNPRTGKRLKVTDSGLPRVGNAVRLTRLRVLAARPSS